MSATAFPVRFPAPPRGVVMSTRGLVVCAHPLAAQAGLAVLRAGGNAFDAALATASTLNVVEPNMSHLAGDAFILAYPAKTGEVIAINASGAAPKSATPEAYHDGIPERGIRAGTVPGIFDGWSTLNERLGTWELERLFESAIEFAENGFPLTYRLHAKIVESQADLARFPSSAAVFLAGGTPPRPGSIFRQPNLGRTLRTLAKGGREAYYQGEIAEAVARFSREVGGHFTVEDFASHRSEVIAPVQTNYRGFTVYEQPPVSQGFVLLEALNLLEGFDLQSSGLGTVETLHRQIECYKLAYADRLAFAGDPSRVKWPLRVLLDKEYASRRRREFDPSRASADTGPGDPQGFEGDTTYFTVADRDGNVVSFIQSLFASFGSAVVLGETGMVLNNRLTGFNLKEGHPNCLEPGKRPIHTLNSYLVLRDGRPYLVSGTRGGHLQIQLNLQSISNVLDFALTPQEAIEAPRWSGYGGADVRLEERFVPEVFDGLRALGHQVSSLPAWSDNGTLSMIQFDHESGTLMGAADPRGEGVATPW
ncbi:MAG: gamma-glutamyltransferase [Chloroflexi bacterium]|nr:gamma-glutamyltransferase [Chloroflexota bacterium]